MPLGRLAPLIEIAWWKLTSVDQQNDMLLSYRIERYHRSSLPLVVLYAMTKEASAFRKGRVDLLSAPITRDEGLVTATCTNALTILFVATAFFITAVVNKAAVFTTAVTLNMWCAAAAAATPPLPNPLRHNPHVDGGLFSKRLAVFRGRILAQGVCELGICLKERILLLFA